MKTSYKGSKLFIEEQLTIITKQGKEIPFALNNVQCQQLLLPKLLVPLRGSQKSKIKSQK
jgi:hypothetical protein